MQERALRLLAPAPIPIRAAILGPVLIPSQAGDCSFRSAPSRRGTFRPIFSGPSGSHSRGHKPRRCSYPALPPSAFHFPATRSWKVGAGQEQVEQCFAARVWVPRASGHFPDGPVGGDDPRSLLGGGGGESVSRTLTPLLNVLRAGT